ncbi:MAG TPA: anti-sigma regulatory factor [Dehalococcoidia bacterium]|nr:anti-sigma regulatory factor [Dehalococcoidia bacterium]
MNAELQYIEVSNEKDIVASRQAARALAAELGFGAIDQSRIATAVSELTRNVVRYATNGRGRVTIRRVGERPGIEIIVADDGPGIENIESAMQDGYTSGSGMGLGLPGTKRLMDEMLIESEPGSGTTVTIRKWRR